MDVHRLKLYDEDELCRGSISVYILNRCKKQVLLKFFLSTSRPTKQQGVAKTNNFLKLSHGLA
ncbi:unnamed protein product [Amoebophrya sp. A120]|nr:unnamed protein product [Amoebophrya sp. A120]|eukprot:GSA120T00000460001.1